MCMGARGEQVCAWWLSAVVVNEQMGAPGRPALAGGQCFQNAPALCVRVHACVYVFCAANILSIVC